MLTYFQNVVPFSKCWPLLKVFTHFHHVHHHRSFTLILDAIFTITITIKCRLSCLVSVSAPFEIWSAQNAQNLETSETGSPTRNPIWSLILHIFGRICDLCSFRNMSSVSQHQSALIDSENPSSDDRVLQCDIICTDPGQSYLFFIILTFSLCTCSFPNTVLL